MGETAKVFPWPSIKDSVPAVVVAGDQAVQLKDTPGARAVMQCRDGRPYLSWLVALPMGPRLAVLALVPLLALRPRHGRWRVWLAASAGATGADEHRRR